MEFLRKDGKHNVYALACTCGAIGEVGVPASKMGVVFAHDTCGALMIQKPSGSMFGKPSLDVVSSK